MAEPTDNSRQYAKVAWITVDIMARFGVDEEEARGFLCRFGNRIEEAMCRAGWDAIDILGEDYLKWTARDWEETEEALYELNGHADEEEEELSSNDDVDWRHEGF